MPSDPNQAPKAKSIPPAESAAPGNPPAGTVPAQQPQPPHGPKTTPAAVNTPKNPPENEDSAQPDHENGVGEDMATAALNPSLEAAIESGILPVMISDSASLPPDAATWAHTSWAHTDWAKLTDAEVMLRVATGDEAGFDLLIAKYRRPIVHYMFRMVHNQAVAEELAQEVFLRVYRSRHTYRAEARFSTWLYRIATNLGVNHARDNKQERTASTLYLDEADSETGSTPDISDGAMTAEQQMLRSERMEAIRDHVMALPERQRNAVLMHKYQDMDYKQIGEVLKLSESATKSLLFRAYQTLRDRLKDFL